MVLGGRAYWKVLGEWIDVTTKGLVSDLTLFALLPCEYMVLLPLEDTAFKAPSWKQINQALTDSTMILDFLSSRNVRNKCLFFII
jgi:hypothetical protein